MKEFGSVSYTHLNRIRFRIPRFLFRYLRPSFAEASTDSSLFPSASACGIVINHASVMNAAEKDVYKRQKKN